MSSVEAPFTENLTLQAVRAAVEARMPVMLVGPPGVGKTATLRQLAKSMGYEAITLIGSQMDPTDVTGLPKGEVVAQDDNGENVYGTVYLAPWWQVRIMKHKKIMLIMDEFSNTPAAVRASLLTMLQNREFPNGMTMPEETIVIGAMNPTDQAADGWELDKPTTNRLLFLVWKSSLAHYFEGMKNAWGEQVSKEELHWRRIIVRFLEDKPSYVHRENDFENGTPEAFNVDASDSSQLEVLRYAWASRRSWDNLARVLGRTERANHALQDEIASGLVGRASAVALREWLMKNSVVSPAAVLADPNSLDWGTVEVSEANIILKEIVELIDKNNWRQGIAVLEKIAKDDSYALVGSYLMEILQKCVRSISETDEKEEAKRLTRNVLDLYKKGAPSKSQ